MSKEKILAAIRSNKPESNTALPRMVFPKGDYQADQLIKQFGEKLSGIGGQCLVLENKAAVQEWINNAFPNAGSVVCNVDGLSQLNSYELPSGKSIEDPDLDAAELKNITLGIFEGQIGVSENAAIWLSEQDMKLRVLPFIVQHLILVLDRKRIVTTMHEAYEQIQIDETGFGVFVAGPSKTADIEQSLVIGAQGARSCTVLLI